MRTNEIAGSACTLPAGSAEQPKGRYSRGYIPHFDAPELLQFVTFRLHDSMPDEKIKAWQYELRTQPKQKRESELRSRILKYIDNAEGDCYLRDERIAKLVEDTLFHRDGEHYRLLAWVIMPNHVHILIETRPEHRLSDLIHSWKSYTGTMANRLLDRTGAFWYREYYDRFIRDKDHYDNVVAYIHHNPVKSKLCESPENWRWSSAWRLCQCFVENDSESAGKVPALPAIPLPHTGPTTN
jgi:REP element-mobilizing transposase RayT